MTGITAHMCRTDGTEIVPQFELKHKRHHTMWIQKQRRQKPQTLSFNLLSVNLWKIELTSCNNDISTLRKLDANSFSCCCEDKGFNNLCCVSFDRYSHTCSFLRRELYIIVTHCLRSAERKQKYMAVKRRMSSQENFLQKDNSKTLLIRRQGLLLLILFFAINSCSGIDLLSTKKSSSPGSHLLFQLTSFYKTNPPQSRDNQHLVVRRPIKLRTTFLYRIMAITTDLRGGDSNSKDLMSMPSCNTNSESNHIDIVNNSTATKENNTVSKWKWEDARRTLFPIYGQEVTKFLLIGSIKFFIILALTLTRDTKDTLVVTQCGAEAIAFLKVSL